jgi:glutaminyl-peptide cyclotransferase
VRTLAVVTTALLLVGAARRGPVLLHAQGASAMLPLYGYSVVKTYPHDPSAFTQGLQYVNGVFYEGTGLNGQSTIRKVKIETGEVLQRRNLGAEHFGEGITLFQSTLYQLTWQSGLAFAYDGSSFAPKRQFTYRGEGWGLTHDGTSLIMSDGTDELRFLDPATFKERRRVKVTAVGQPVRELNELEFVKGELFANVWQTDYIARIDPATGKVSGWIDLRGLLTPRERLSTDVLNGIAYDAAGNRLFVTGKLWPKVFEIALKRTR